MFNIPNNFVGEILYFEYLNLCFDIIEIFSLSRRNNEFLREISS